MAARQGFYEFPDKGNYTGSFVNGSKSGNGTYVQEDGAPAVL